MQPDFLVFAGNHTETMPVGVEALSGLPGWRILDAVRNHRYITTSDAIDRPAPRLVSAIEDLAKKFHPEAFPDNPGTTQLQPTQNCPEVLSAYPNPCHPESPRFGRGEGSAFLAPQLPAILSRIPAAQPANLAKDPACAR